MQTNNLGWAGMQVETLDPKNQRVCILRRSIAHVRANRSGRLGGRLQGVRSSQAHH